MRRILCGASLDHNRSENPSSGLLEASDELRGVLTVAENPILPIARLVALVDNALGGDHGGGQVEKGGDSRKVVLGSGQHPDWEHPVVHARVSDADSPRPSRSDPGGEEAHTPKGRVTLSITYCWYWSFSRWCFLCPHRHQPRLRCMMG